MRWAAPRESSAANYSSGRKRKVATPRNVEWISNQRFMRNPYNGAFRVCDQGTPVPTRERPAYTRLLPNDV